MGVLDTKRWRQTRLAILRRDGYVCHWCDGRATSVDHLKSRAEGGQPYDPRNLVAACLSCNGRRGGLLVSERARGRTLGARLSPAERVVTTGAIRA